jgi:putative ABC transport system permease protein
LAYKLAWFAIQPGAMLKNYLLLALKNCRKQKTFSLINVLGLTVGIVCCLMIFVFIMNEFSYDNFHKNGDHIYRVMRRSENEGAFRDIPYLAPPYAKALQNDYPEAIQHAVRVATRTDLITYNNISYKEKKSLLADSNFFQFFSFKLLKGNPATVLADPMSMVMTASTVKKYFGNEDPIGKVVTLNNDLQFKITGVAADVPANSTLDFDIIMPTTHWQSSPFYNQWTSNGVFVYVQLNPAVQPGKLMKLFPAFMERYLGDFYRQTGFKNQLIIRPLKGIYFETETTHDELKHGSKKMVYIFMSIAILILLIACINFMNLATARATDRSKEVGMRKVMGAMRKQLAWQFIFESLLFATVAAICALGLLQLVMPAYTSFLGYKLTGWWSNPWVYVFVVGVIAIVGLLAGSYPALLMSSFSPIEALKGKLKIGKEGAFFRKALVVFQFGISVLLIISVAVVMKQMHYVQHVDMGFSKEQTMIVRLDNRNLFKNKVQFKNALQSDPAVTAVSMMSGEPGGFHDGHGFEVEGHPGEKLQFSTEFADFEFVKTLQLKIIAGRDFNPALVTDSVNSVLINRAAAAHLGFTPQQAVGKWIKNINRDSLPRTIVGVVEDYNFTSLKNAIAPLVISTYSNDRRLVLIRLKTAEIHSVIERIKKVYTKVSPDYPFEYSFLDEQFNQLYEAEIKQETLLSVFSLIAIGIACLGLFGLASYTAIKRSKEIGVRKVLGSSVENIVLLLSKDLLKPVLIGTLIAIPAGYFIMQYWLQNFVYRTPIQWWLFLAAAMVAVFIALFTVSVQAIKVALVNPIKSLRTE